MKRCLLYFKFCLYALLAYLPGRIGSAFETRWYWVRRHLNMHRVSERFDAHLATLGPESMCIDLGANVGDITARLAAHAGHVHAFEPDPWAFEKLQERFADIPNVTLHNAAIGNRDGTLELMRDPDFDRDRASTSQGTSAYSSELWGNGEPERFSVPLTDIRRFLKDLARPVDIIKVDIEGGEADLLEALLEAPERTNVRSLYVETHEAQMPELRPRLIALRQRVRSMTEPQIFLDWQ